MSFPVDVIKRVKVRLPGTEFGLVAEYIAFVTQEVLHRIKSETEDDGFERINEQKLANRSESLGYLEN